MKLPFITKTVKRTATWYATVMIGLYLLFNFFTLLELNYILVDDIDSRLTHELEHILNTLEIAGDSVVVIHPRELEEPDLLFLTDNPYFLQIYDLEGYIFQESKNISLYENIELGFPNKFDPYYFEDQNTAIDQLRTVYKELFNEKNEKIGYIQLSVIQSTFNQVLKSILYLNLITLPLILTLIVVLSIFLAKKSYEPINKIILLADSISATNLSKRLVYEADSNDELSKLKNTLNSLFIRLENQVKEISQFTDNASHQLMTPLTAIKTELDYILKRDHPIDEYKDTLSILKSQADRMILMIRSMLIMSRECNNCSNKTNVFNLSNLINNEIKILYESKNIQFQIESEVYVRGKSEYFSIVLQNLISNALKYSPKGKPITVNLQANNSITNLQVIDEGIGISDNEKSKVFKRFYRVESDVVQKKSGYGLGLSLVESVTRSMEGEVNIIDNHPSGTIFEIKLPLLKFH